MKKTVRLTESDLTRIVKKVMNESPVTLLMGLCLQNANDVEDFIRDNKDAIIRKCFENPKTNIWDIMKSMYEEQTGKHYY